ncbi:MAG: DUF2934 domain-containing protein [Isosphaeraceae bacterium]
MFPTAEQIRTAAYLRWERRGLLHGRDVDDWAAAEQDLLFSLNYELIAHHKLDAGEPAFVGRRSPRVCRFCEGSPPRSPFADAVRPIPQALGNQSLLALDECDECHVRFTELIVTDFERFILPYLAGKAAPGRGASPPIPVSAYKGLIQMALAILPPGELEYVPDAIEWVGNDDHDADLGAFAGLGLGCYVHSAGPYRAPFAAIARRTADDAPMPYLLFFLGTSGMVFQAPIPLCIRDEDLEAGAMIVPRVAIPSNGPPYAPIEYPTCSFLPLAAREAQRPARSRP